ncbi:hypothetical protein HanHA300_Chr03g0097401 [Helianthus annuus]|nr:hypothetical protein HanHA300_Chr03g0097401 [Helianthus annuus]
MYQGFVIFNVDFFIIVDIAVLTKSTGTKNAKKWVRIGTENNLVQYWSQVPNAHPYLLYISRLFFLYFKRVKHIMF